MFPPFLYVSFTGCIHLICDFPKGLELSEVRNLLPIVWVFMINQS